MGLGITATGLTMTYGDLRAVDDVSLRLDTSAALVRDLDAPVSRR